jgi:arabinogalactan oligomer / maltooligosaccharide transport system substrate-binding protein
MEILMGRKWSTPFSLLIVSALFLAACGSNKPTPTPAGSGGPAPQASPTGQTVRPNNGPTRTPGAWNGTITIWHQWGGAYLVASQQIFQSYEELHPGVKITLVQPMDLLGGIKDAVLTGQGPDIVDLTNDQIGALAEAGTIIDLGRLGVQRQDLASTFEPAAVAGVTFQNKVWALPETQQGIALVYNKALLSPDQRPVGGNNFNDLYNKAKDYAAKHSGEYLVCSQGFGNPDAAAVAPIFFGFGVTSFVDEAGKVHLDTTEALQAAEWLSHFAQFAPATASYTICKNMFITQKAAAIWTSPIAMNLIQAANIDFGIIPMGKPFVTVNALMLTQNAIDHSAAEVALDVMQFYTNAQNAEKLALAGKVIPANTAALRSSPVAGDPVLSGFGAALHVGVAMSTSPYANAQWQPVATAATSIWSGKVKPVDALAAAQKAIEDAIAALK